MKTDIWFVSNKVIYSIWTLTEAIENCSVHNKLERAGSDYEGWSGHQNYKRPTTSQYGRKVSFKIVTNLVYFSCKNWNLHFSNPSNWSRLHTRTIQMSKRPPTFSTMSMRNVTTDRINFRNPSSCMPNREEWISWLQTWLRDESTGRNEPDSSERTPPPSGAPLHISPPVWV